MVEFRKFEYSGVTQNSALQQTTVAFIKVHYSTICRLCPLDAVLPRSGLDVYNATVYWITMT